MREPVRFQGKIIGDIDKEKQLYISHRRREHIFRKFGNGFGLSAKVIDVLYSQDIVNIVIIFEDKQALFATLDLFITKGEKWMDGDDEQMILPQKFFTEKRVEEEQAKLP